MIHSVKINFKLKLLAVFLSLPIVTLACQTSANEFENEAASLATDALGYVEYDAQKLFFVPQSYQSKLAELLRERATNSPEKDLVIFIQNKATNDIIFQQTASGRSISKDKLEKAAALVSSTKPNN